jgi:hypothetical protein
MKNTIVCIGCGTPLLIADEIRVIRCPKCRRVIGNPLKNDPLLLEGKKSNHGCRSILLVSVIIFVVLYIIGSLMDTDGTSNVKNSVYDGSVHQVEQYLKGTLKDPKSYDAMEWSNVEHNSDGQHIVRHKYRAKNSYGGYVIENKIFYLDDKGNVIKTSD